MGTGTNLFLLGELARAETAAHRAAGAGALGAIGAENSWKKHHEQFVFAAKGQVHGFRSFLHGHRVIEDQLIAALKLENANHPLASREAVEAAVIDERTKALLNPEVIKRTYPDGKLPDGVIVTQPDLTIQAVA